ncbi:unnamed protein product [Mytilus coruscus]|uniref:Uncharacterized protein n=1 Tax=Mytilus coruscus TaxID=42192 RepID=A0A6J8DE49_MYTCO|nr:unnamed protein product [Mytilus coruscus]
MKQHLKKIHDIGNALKLETQLTSCKEEVRENKGFVDPGVFIFCGRTKVSTTSTSTTSLLTNTVTTMGNTSTPSFTTTPSFTVNVSPKFPETQRRPPLLPLPDLPIIPDRTPFSVTSRISQEYKSRSQPETTTENAYPGHPAMVEPNNHSGCTSTVTSSEIQTTEPNNQSGCKTTFTSSETQTSLTDLPPLVLPLIPETRLEVESLLRWLCNSMDMIGWLRESAKQKLEEIKESGSRQQEREIRRKLEAENRELRRQIAENKWRNELFQDIAKQ